MSYRQINLDVSSDQTLTIPHASTKGYTFEWTPQHPNSEQLDRLRSTYDSLADETIEVLTPLRNGKD